MAKQWQLRRGTTSENNAFTGAVGEVTVDTTTHELRVHDGTTAGGHVVGNTTHVTVDNSDLFDFKFTDHLLDNESWARADLFDWMYKSNYPEAYNHLKTEFDAIEKATYYYWASAGHEDRYCWTESRYPEIGDTIYYDIEQGLTGEVTGYDSANDTLSISYDGHNWSVPYVDEVHDGAEYDVISGTTIEYYIAADGHKIALADQETNISSVYASTEVAWYYIIDITNERFKLPRAKPLTDAIIGNGKTLGITDGTYTVGFAKSAGNTGDFTPAGTAGSSIGGNIGTTPIFNGDVYAGITTDPTKSGVIVKRNASDQYKYLYFYLKPTSTQVDCHRVIQTQLPTTENNYTWYRLYSDGWVEQGGIITDISQAVIDWTSKQITLPLTMSDTNYNVIATDCGIGSENWSGTNIDGKTVNNFYYRYYNANANAKISWEVSGIAAI